MMTTFRKSRKWVLALFAAAPVATYAAAPRWTEKAINEVYVELRDYSENKQLLAEAQEKLVVMHENLELVKNRISRKESILDQLESQQVSLTAAGAAFLELDRENEPSYAMEYRPGSLAECAQARVIKFLKIRHRESTDGPRFASVIRRLDGEFESRFGYPAPRE